MHEDRTSTHESARPLARRATAAIALAVTLLAGLLGGVPTSTSAVPDATLSRVVVEATGDLAAVTRAVADHGGRVVEVLAPFRMVVAEVPAGTVDDLAGDPATGGVTPDTPMQVQSAGVASATPAAAAVASTPAGDPEAGDGVGVVVVDTGIAPHRDLGDRVVARYEYEAEPGRRGDRHGHGTFMAGLVAADGAHPGVAPSSHLVSVRVADEHGETTLSRVLHGLVIADMAREQHDAPVVLLALSGQRAPVPDPLMIVLEMLWARGSTVVVAAGNSDTGELASPGWDPYLITAGALDQGDDLGDPADDSVPGWSGRGVLEAQGPTGELTWQKPDVVAPGVSVVGLRAPGSTIDRDNRDARVDGRYFVGSGTSMAAAHTAGAAAAVLAANEDLTPDQVKGILRDTAADVAGADDVADGDGALDVAAAVAAAQATDGDGHDGNQHVGPLPTPDTDGELDPDGWAWDGWAWDGWAWDGWAWDGWAWDGWTWDGWTWDGWTWDGWSWDGWSWDGWSWDGWSWDGWTWDGWTWDGWAWNSATWGDGTA